LVFELILKIGGEDGTTIQVSLGEIRRDKVDDVALLGRCPRSSRYRPAAAWNRDDAVRVNSARTSALRTLRRDALDQRLPADAIS